MIQLIIITIAALIVCALAAQLLVDIARKRDDAYTDRPSLETRTVQVLASLAGVLLLIGMASL